MPLSYDGVRDDLAGQLDGSDRNPQRLLMVSQIVPGPGARLALITKRAGP